jgi:hypothetical protein
MTISLTGPEDSQMLMQIGAPTIDKTLPDAYRLARFQTEEGRTHLKLQGYFTWYQGCMRALCGEWRDIETVDADASDDEPYGPLP